MHSAVVVSFIRNYFVEFVCFLLFLLFSYAALVKWLDHASFVLTLGKSPMLKPFAWWVAVFLPLSELIIGFMVVTQRLRTPGLYASYFLLALFTFYIVAVTQFSFQVPCSCGGILSGMGWHEHLIFNISFCILTLAALVLHRREQP